MPTPRLAVGSFPQYFGYGLSSPQNVGFSIWDGNVTITTITSGLDNPNVLAIAAKSPTEVYVGTYGGGLSIWNGSNISSTKRTYNSGIINDTIQSLVIGNDQKVYIGTPTGLSVYDGNTFTNYTTANGLANNNCARMIVDSAGLVYIWNYYGNFGISVFNPASNTITSHLSGEQIVGATVCSDGFVYLLVPYNVLRKWDGVSNTSTFVTSLGSGNGYNSNIFSNNGKVYYTITNNGYVGLNIWDGSTLQEVLSTNLNGDNSCVTMQFNVDGNIYFGLSNQGWIQFDGTYFNIPIIEAPGGLAGSWVMTSSQIPAYIPTNIRTVGTKILGDITVDPTTSAVIMPNTSSIPTGSVLRNTLTNNKYLKTSSGLYSYDTIPATPDPSWSWTTASAAWSTLQNS